MARSPAWMSALAPQLPAILRVTKRRQRPPTTQPLISRRQLLKHRPNRVQQRLHRRKLPHRKQPTAEAARPAAPKEETTAKENSSRSVPTSVPDTSATVTPPATTTAPPTNEAPPPSDESLRVAASRLRTNIKITGRVVDATKV